MPLLTAPPAKNCFAAYGIWLYREKSPAIKSLKKQLTPSVHGDRQWDSSHLLMDYISSHPFKPKSKILDVGCGWGPASIFLARQGYSVTGLDVDPEVFAFLQLQAQLNQVKVKVREGNMKSMKADDLAKFDVIVGGDICFWDELANEWLSMLKRAAKAGVKQLILADPGRPPFFALAEKCGSLWPIELQEWYSLEPKRFEGYILSVKLKSAR